MNHISKWCPRNKKYNSLGKISPRILYTDFVRMMYQATTHHSIHLGGNCFTPPPEFKSQMTHGPL